MQKFFNKQFYGSLITMAILTLIQAVVFAQDSSTTSSTTTTSTSTQTATIQPWVWIVGGIVLLIIIIALLRGRGSKDKVVVTKETTRE